MKRDGWLEAAAPPPRGAGRDAAGSGGQSGDGALGEADFAGQGLEVDGVARGQGLTVLAEATLDAGLVDRVAQPACGVVVDVAAELPEIDVHRVPQALVAAAPHGGGASGGAGAQQTGGGGRRGDEQLVLGGGDGRVNPEERTVDVAEVARLGVDAVNFQRSQTCWGSREQAWRATSFGRSRC